MTPPENGRGSIHLGGPLAHDDESLKKAAHKGAQEALAGLAH